MLTPPAAAAAVAKSLQSCPTLCDPIDGSPPGSPVPGILKARTLEWVASLPLPHRILSASEGQTCSPGFMEKLHVDFQYCVFLESQPLDHQGSPFFFFLFGSIQQNAKVPQPGVKPWPLWWKPAAAAAKSLQSCPTLCNSIDGNPRGSPVPWIPQARTLDWVAISFSNA